MLNKIDLTAALAHQLQIDLAQHASLMVYRPGEEVFRQGDIGNLFYIIITGNTGQLLLNVAMHWLPRILDCIFVSMPVDWLFTLSVTS